MPLADVLTGGGGAPGTPILVIAAVAPAGYLADPVPEPASLTLLGSGILILGSFSMMRHRKTRWHRATEGAVLHGTLQDDAPAPASTGLMSMLAA